MKKLVIAALAVAFAAVAQAASVKWTATNVYNGQGDSSVKVNGIAYFVLASDIADFTALAGKGASAISTALADSYNYSPSTAGTYSLTKTNAELGLADATSYGKAYLVVFDTATITDDSKFFVTKQIDLETYGGDNTASLAFGSQATPSKVAGNWYDVAAIPEPTSGLLMLLGMAGLALRRRRA